MTNVIKFGKQNGLPMAFETETDPRRASAAVENVPVVLWDHSRSAPTDASRLVAASDLARKHGITLDRAEMLVDRFGSDRHGLECAAQQLRTWMD